MATDLKDLVIGKHKVPVEKLQWSNSRLSGLIFYAPLVERLTGKTGVDWTRRETRKELNNVEKALYNLKESRARASGKLREVAM
jgi:hypothetical protein